MNSKEIVNQLLLTVPFLTDEFSDVFDVANISRASNILTVTTTQNHNFIVGKSVILKEAKTPISITFTRSGNVGTIVTSEDHDLTFGKQIAEKGLNVATSGAVEPEFNGSFQVTAIPDKNTILVFMVDAGPTNATGSPVVENAQSIIKQFNGVYEILSTPSSDSFTIETSLLTEPLPIGNIKCCGNVRIQACLNSDLIPQVITSDQLEGKSLLFVSFGPANVSKDRNLKADATSNIQTNSYMRYQLINTLILSYVADQKDSVAGSEGIDRARALLPPFLRSVLGYKPSTQLFKGSMNRLDNNPIQLVGHDLASYNNGVIVYEYLFEQTEEITFEDAYQPQNNVALRGIDIDAFNNDSLSLAFESEINF